MTIRVQAVESIVIGRGISCPGPAIPDNLVDLPDDRLRVVDDEVVDAADISTWYVDDMGERHAVDGEDRSIVECSWDSPLIRDAGVWRVRIDADPVGPGLSTDPADYPLNRFQFEGMLMAMGVTFARIESEIGASALTDIEKAFAISRLRNAVSYRRDHPLVAMLMPTLGLSDQDVDEAWLAAKDVR